MNDPQLTVDDLRRRCQELGEARDALLAERRRYEDLFQFAPDSYIVTDQNGVITEANHAAARLLNCSAQALVSQRFAAFVAAGDRARFDRQALELLASGWIEGFNFEVCPRDNRDPVAVSATAQCAFSADREVRGIRWSIRDVSVQTRAEAESRAKANRLDVQRRLTSIGTVVASIAHDINNPINSILMSAHFASKRLDHVDARQTIEECLNIIVEAAERCVEITRNLVSSTKPSVTQKWSTDLNAVIRRTVDLLGTGIYAPNIAVQLALSDDLPPVLADMTEIEQILINLVHNASQSSPGPVRLRIATARKGEKIELSVSDDGPGIPGQHVHRIFEPFFTTRAEAGGAGLGLATVKRIVEQHNGAVLVESERGSGTTFLIQLPALTAAEEAPVVPIVSIPPAP